MRKRFKRLKKRVYGYDQLCEKIERWRKGPHWDETNRPACVLYGGLRVTYHERQECLQLVWRGNLARAGGPKQDATILIASVNRSIMDGSLYAVHGLAHTDSSPQAYKAALRVWRRYVKAFTPHDPAARHLAARAVAHYLVSGGLWSEVTKEKDSTGPGVWMSPPRFAQRSPQEWIRGWPGKDEFAGLPKFQSRSRRFVRDLKKRLSEIGVFDVSLALPEQTSRLYRKSGPDSRVLTILVCTPPSRVKDGRRLTVSMSPHSGDSRKRFGMSVEQGQRHSYYTIRDNNGGWSEYGRGRDALDAIVEIAMDSIYIPGPE